jgi:ABC-type oligopeptide transport system substrate-binding subunit
MKIKIIMFLILGISVAGACFAQSDFSSTGYQKEDSFSMGNGSDSAGTNSGRDTNDQQGNLFPNSSSERANGVYTTGPNSGSYIHDQGSLSPNSISEKDNGVYTAGINSGTDTNDQDNLFSDSISGKANGDYGLTGGITTH